MESTLRAAVRLSCGRDLHALFASPKRGSGRKSPTPNLGHTFWERHGSWAGLKPVECRRSMPPPRCRPFQNDFALGRARRREVVMAMGPGQNSQASALCSTGRLVCRLSCRARTCVVETPGVKPEIDNQCGMDFEPLRNKRAGPLSHVAALSVGWIDHRRTTACERQSRCALRAGTRLHGRRACRRKDGSF